MMDHDVRNHRMGKRQTTGSVTNAADPTGSGTGTGTGTGTGSTTSPTSTNTPTSTSTTPTSTQTTASNTTPTNTSQTSVSTPTSLSTTGKTTSPTGPATGTLTVIQTITGGSTPIPSGTPTSDSTPGFFQNTAAVGATFTVVGLAVIALLFLLFTTAIRRRRARKFDEDVSAAAAAAAASARSAPVFQDDFEEPATSEGRHYGKPMSVSDDYRRGGSGYGGDVYNMREMQQHPYGGPMIPGMAGFGARGLNQFGQPGPPPGQYGGYGYNQPHAGFDQYGYPVQTVQGYHPGYEQQYGIAPHHQAHETTPVDEDDAYGGAYIQHDPEPPQPSAALVPPPAPHPYAVSPPMSNRDSISPAPLASTGSSVVDVPQSDPAPQYPDHRESLLDAHDYTGQRVLKVANE